MSSQETVTVKDIARYYSRSKKEIARLSVKRQMLEQFGSVRSPRYDVIPGGQHNTDNDMRISINTYELDIVKKLMRIHQNIVDLIENEVFKSVILKNPEYYDVIVECYVEQRYTLYGYSEEKKNSKNQISKRTIQRHLKEINAEVINDAIVGKVERMEREIEEINYDY